MTALSRRQLVALELLTGKDPIAAIGYVRDRSSEQIAQAVARGDDPDPLTVARYRSVDGLHAEAMQIAAQIKASTSQVIRLVLADVIAGDDLDAESIAERVDW